MDIRNIQTFIRVVEMGSITRAAEELNYVQSTVTSQIQQLEKELGFPLFDRIGKRISITAPGQEFLRYANEILHITQKVNAMGSDPKKMAGTLRIGVLESLLFTAMLDILPAFKLQYQKVDVQLKMGQVADLLVLLKQNQLDMVYISGDLNTDPDLFCCYKRKENLIFVTSPYHPAARRKEIPLADLLEYDFLVTERSGICYGRVRGLASAHQLPLRHPMEVDSTIAIARLLKKGMGVAFLPEYSVAEDLRKGSLVKVDVQMEPQTYYSQILYHKSKWLAPFMECFLELTRENRPAN